MRKCVNPGQRHAKALNTNGSFNVVKGSVATPSGVEWRKSGNGLQVTATGRENLTPVLASFEETPGGYPPLITVQSFDSCSATRINIHRLRQIVGSYCILIPQAGSVLSLSKDACVSFHYLFSGTDYCFL